MKYSTGILVLFLISSTNAFLATFKKPSSTGTTYATLERDFWRLDYRDEEAENVHLLAADELSIPPPPIDLRQGVVNDDVSKLSQGKTFICAASTRT